MTVLVQRKLPGSPMPHEAIKRALLFDNFPQLG